MKKSIVIVICLLMTVPVMAQTYAFDKGSICLGGSFAYTSQGGDLYEYDGDNLNTLTMAPIINYFISPGIAIGPYFQYQKASQGKASNSLYGIGPKILITLSQSSNKGQAVPFLAAFAGWGKYKYEYDDDWDGDYKSESNVMRYGFSGGIFYMLTESVSLTLEVAYQSDSYKADGADKSVKGNNLIFGIGISGFVF